MQGECFEYCDRHPELPATALESSSPQPRQRVEQSRLIIHNNSSFSSIIDCTSDSVVLLTTARAKHGSDLIWGIGGFWRLQRLSLLRSLEHQLTDPWKVLAQHHVRASGRALPAGEPAEHPTSRRMWPKAPMSVLSGGNAWANHA